MPDVSPKHVGADGSTYDAVVSKTRAPRMPAAERRQALLDLAVEMVSEEGFDALRMDWLATRAGVTRPVVYEHFADRQGLVIAVMQLLAIEMAAAIGAVQTEPDDDLEHILRAETHAFFDLVGQRGRAIRAVLVAENISPAVDDARRQMMNRPIKRWADRFVAYAGIPRDEAEALAAAQLVGVNTVADRWSRGLIPRKRAEDLHVLIAMAAIDALRDR